MFCISAASHKRLSHHTPKTVLFPFSALSQAAISNQRDEFQQLVLGVVQREVVPEIKEDQFKNGPLCSVLREVVTTLSDDLSWLQATTIKQNFYWGIVASCCEKIPITTKNFEWFHLYESVITCLGSIYNSYCTEKNLPEYKCLLSAKEFPQEVAHSPSEDIKKYELIISVIILCPFSSIAVSL